MGAPEQVSQAACLTSLAWALRPFRSIICGDTVRAEACATGAGALKATAEEAIESCETPQGGCGQYSIYRDTRAKRTVRS